jgi:ABC-type sugar transport system permease subunit
VLTIVMHFYQISFRQMEFGYGSATAYVLFVIIAVVSSILVRVLNQDNQS